MKFCQMIFKYKNMTKGERYIIVFYVKVIIYLKTLNNTRTMV